MEASAVPSAPPFALSKTAANKRLSRINHQHSLREQTKAQRATSHGSFVQQSREEGKSHPRRKQRRLSSALR